MCDPSATNSMSQLGLYSSIAGTANSTIGAIANSVNTRRTANANAMLAEHQAADAIARGQSAEFNSRLKTSQLKQSQVAAFAGRGIALDTGSPLSVLTSTDVMGEADAQTIRDNAAKEAWGYDVQASNYKAQASAANPWSTGMGSLLGGAGAVASKWYRYKAISSGKYSSQDALADLVTQ